MPLYLRSIENPRRLALLGEYRFYRCHFPSFRGTILLRQSYILLEDRNQQQPLASPTVPLTIRSAFEAEQSCRHCSLRSREGLTGRLAMQPPFHRSTTPAGTAFPALSAVLARFQMTAEESELGKRVHPRSIFYCSI
jgi:hypothetical protein